MSQYSSVISILRLENPCRSLRNRYFSSGRGKSHNKYQLYVRERHVKSEFRERDGMLIISPKDDAVILLSAKARFGPATELIRRKTSSSSSSSSSSRGTLSAKERRCMRFHQGLRSTVGSALSSTYFVGVVATAPLISERVLDWDSGGYAPPIAFMSRHIPQEYSYAAALAVPFLFARSLANKMFMRCNR
eukprot:gene35062-45385_t